MNQIWTKISWEFKKNSKRKHREISSIKFREISLKSPQLILRLLLATRDIEIVQFTVQTAAFPPSCTLARKVILTFNHVRNNYPHQQCERFFLAASFIARSGMHWITVRHRCTKLGNNTIRNCNASIFQNAQHCRKVFSFFFLLNIR